MIYLKLLTTFKETVVEDIDEAKEWIRLHNTADVTEEYEDVIAEIVEQKYKTGRMVKDPKGGVELIDVKTQSSATRKNDILNMDSNAKVKKLTEDTIEIESRVAVPKMVAEVSTQKVVVPKTVTLTRRVSRSTTEGEVWIKDLSTMEESVQLVKDFIK